MPDGSIEGRRTDTSRRIAHDPDLSPPPPTAPVPLDFDGRAIAARPGESLLAALWTAGVRTLRTMPGTGAPRGGYCLVGRCSDCLVQVDGLPNVPACVTQVRAGMRVATQHGVGSLPETVENPNRPAPAVAFTRPAGEGDRTSKGAAAGYRCQVAVIGAGPAGLAAAIAAAELGAMVTLVDERWEAGGRLLIETGSLAVPWLPGADGLAPSLLADRLRRRAIALGVEVRLNTVAWGIFPGLMVPLAPTPWVPQAGLDQPLLQPERLILATGATDLPWPFPGGTLPGVWSGTACATLLHRDRVVLGVRAAVIGDGLEAAVSVADLRRAGTEVVAVIDPGDARVVAEGEGRVRRIVVDGQAVAVDVVVVAVGRQPDFALASLAGADSDFLPDAGWHAARLDDRGETTVPGLFVAGDAARPDDLATALVEGRRAGLEVAASLGLGPPRGEDRARGRTEAGRPRVWSPPPPIAANDDAAPNCFGCRCEQVSLAEIRTAITAGARTVNDVKRHTRAGMGLCQGIYCLPTIMALLRAASSDDPAATLPMTARPPIRPIPLDSLVLELGFGE